MFWALFDDSIRRNVQGIVTSVFVGLIGVAALALSIKPEAGLSLILFANLALVLGLGLAGSDAPRRVLMLLPCPRALLARVQLVLQVIVPVLLVFMLVSLGVFASFSHKLIRAILPTCTFLLAWNSLFVLMAYAGRAPDAPGPSPYQWVRGTITAAIAISPFWVAFKHSNWICDPAFGHAIPLAVAIVLIVVAWFRVDRMAPRHDDELRIHRIDRPRRWRLPLPSASTWPFAAPMLYAVLMVAMARAAFVVFHWSPNFLQHHPMVAWFVLYNLAWVLGSSSHVGSLRALRALPWSPARILLWSDREPVVFGLAAGLSTIGLFPEFDPTAILLSTLS